MSEIERSLGRVEGKLDSVIELLREHATTQKEHGKRLNSLERARYAWALLAGTIGGLFGFGGGHLPKL